MKNKQQGITLISALIGLGFVMFFGLVAMRLLPMYQEFYGVTTVMKSMEDEMRNSTLTKQQAWTFLRKRLDSSYVDSVKKEHVKFYRGKTGTGVGRIVVDYKVQTPFMGNLDLLANFHSEASVD
jgi:hypothetical protein